MILNRNFMLALAVTGSAAVAAVLAIQRNMRRHERVQQQTDLQRWEGETGSTGPSTTEKRLS
jgi:hypothetical protein